ncbi:MAG: patatin-like phospholipase family protein [Bacteroidetes bacterium]|nr:patatin-like phospholipase family protein [Fibrella sp.]
MPTDQRMAPPAGSPKRALVLGGGSLKGAFQTGAVVALLDNGFIPDSIYGISVGSMNATFLAHEAARQFIDTNHVDWPKAGRILMENWQRYITRPQDVAVIRPRWRTGYDTILSRFDGFLDNTPIKNLIRTLVDPAVLRQSPVGLKVGAVNLMGGEMLYVDPTNDQFLDYVFASSAVPFIMPAVPIGDNRSRVFLDGGLREVAPLREAFDDGATEIVCIACHASGTTGEPFNHRNLLSLMDRITEITVNQLVNNDINWARRHVALEKLHGRDVKLTIIRPDAPLTLNLMKFNSDDISRLIVQGYQTGTDALRR